MYVYKKKPDADEIKVHTYKSGDAFGELALIMLLALLLAVWVEGKLSCGLWTGVLQGNCGGSGNAKRGNVPRLPGQGLYPVRATMVSARHWQTLCRREIRRRCHNLHNSRR